MLVYYLGFIMRNCSSFNDPFTFKCLFTSIVRSHLEYATIIWDSNTIGISNHIEAVQNNFFRFISFKFNIERPPHSDYINVSNFLNLKSLADRRKDSYVILLKNILNNRIDDSYLLSIINLKINRHNIRDPCLFYIPHTSLRYMLFSPINTLLTNGNSVNTVIDFFL
jgi:hypothetical protein